MRAILPLLVLLLLMAPALGQTVAGVDAGKEVATIREMLAQSLDLYRAGDAEASFAQARDAYLDHYELLEPPLRLVDANHVIGVEAHFADLRAAIRNRAPLGEVEERIRELNRDLDRSLELLRGAGASIAGVAGVLSFSIIFREGLEAVLLLGIIVGYLETSKNTALKKHVWLGALAALFATAGTWLLLQTVVRVASARSRELVEGVTSLLAVAVMFYVTFWILRRIEYRKWVEFIRAKVWASVTTGSVLVMAGVAFFAVYREGVETALFYQALFQLARGLEGAVALGFLAGVAALAAVAFAVFRLGVKIPTRLFFGIVIAIVVFLSVAFIGNGLADLQETALLPTTRLPLPRLGASAEGLLGYRPTLETLSAQIVLASVYAAGALYALVLKPRWERRFAEAKIAEREAGKPEEADKP